MNELIELKPKFGLGALKFGSSKEQVKALLGEPEEEEKIDEAEEYKTLIWHYWDQGVSVFFDEAHHNRVTSLEVDNCDTELWGKKIFHMKEAEIIALFKEHSFTELDTEDCDWGERRVSFDDAFVDLYFEDNELSSINFGVVMDDMEIVLWPN